MQMTVQELQQALHAQGNIAERASCVVHGVQTDNRLLQAGEVFFCLAGERFDGHSFAAKALAQGAAAVVSERPAAFLDGVSENDPILLVPSTVKALGDLARYHRDHSKSRVLGVTGTAGKTTVKELLFALLGKKGSVAKNYLNKNNQIGLPQSMLAASGNETYWVMEAGISHAGDMEELGAILAPNIALVLNAGQGHTLGLGEKGVAYHKAQFTAFVQGGGSALVCADYPDLVREALAVQERKQEQAQQLKQGADAKGVKLFFFSAQNNPHNAPNCAFTGAYLGAGQNGLGRFALMLNGESVEVSAPLRGAYGAENVVAVAAAAYLAGMTAQEICAAFATLTPENLPQQRFARHACGKNGAWQIIDDSYNANPLSATRMVSAAAELFSELQNNTANTASTTGATAAAKTAAPNAANTAQPRALIYILGEMLELGDAAEPAHFALGQHLAAQNPALIFWKGGNEDAVRRGLNDAKRQGLNNATWHGTFYSIDDLNAKAIAPHTGSDAVEQILRALPYTGGVVLCKGSRSNKMEFFIDVLKKAFA